jgi:surfeit locus 1 family protein
LRRFPWILTLFTIPALALLIGLGVWQVQRLRWKEGLIDQAEAASTAAPEPIETVRAAADPEFRKALVVCPGLETAPFVELQSIHDSGAGARLISICRAPGQARPFLIDRGFLPEAVTARPRVAESTMPLSLLVELRRTPKAGGGMTPAPADNRFYARDSAATYAHC